MADTQLFLDGGRVADDWVYLDDEAALPAGRSVIVSVERWQADREALVAAGNPIGLKLRSEQTPALIANDVGYFAVIALDFPRYTDGRAYSYARLLRDRYGFRGQLRAVGNVLADQLFLMRRCGFDAFESDDSRTLSALEQGGQVDVELAYQHAGDQRLTISEMRRQAARALGLN